MTAYSPYFAMRVKSQTNIHVFYKSMRKSWSPWHTSVGFNDESVRDELLVDGLNENQLLECFENLDDFPFDSKHQSKDDDAKKQFILDLLRRIETISDIIFEVNIPAS